MEHESFIEKVKLGKKGQVTIPKKIREEDSLKENDVFVVQHTMGGNIILTKQTTKTPEDLMLDAIMRAPKINAKGAWEEIKRERKLDR